MASGRIEGEGVFLKKMWCLGSTEPKFSLMSPMDSLRPSISTPPMRSAK